MIADETNPRVAVGNNSGATMKEIARDSLREALEGFRDRRDQFVKSAGLQTVRNRDTAGAAGDTIKLAGEVWAMVLAERTKRSDPFREVHHSLVGQALEFWAPVEEAMATLRRQIDDWSAAEDDRIAAQQREQEEAMAAMRAESAPPAPAAPRSHIDYSAPAAPPTPRVAPPAMKPPHRRKIHGDLGATITSAAKVEYEIADITQVPMSIIDTPTVRAAILTVVRATAKHMGVPAGISTSTQNTNQIR